MPDLTDCLLLPYPLQTDTPDVVRDVQALAERVDDLLCGTTGEIDALKSEMLKRVKNAGDTMTGTLTSTSGGPAVDARRPGNAPFIAFSSYPDGATRYGYVQGTANGMWIASEVGTLSITAPAGDLNLSGQAVRTLGNLRAHAGATIWGGAGSSLSLHGASKNAFISLYSNAAHIDSWGTRSGWIGFPGNDHLYMVNEGTGAAVIRGSSGVFLEVSGVNALSATGAGIAVNKGSTGSPAAVGVECHTNGTIWCTTGTGNAGIYSIHTGFNANDRHITFMVNASGALLSYIANNSALNGLVFPNVTTSAPSDGRLKDDLGLITGALDKIDALMPKRLRWRSNEEEFDGFIAQEVREVMPEAVVGDFDKPPQEAMVGIDYDRITPWIVAAIQELRVKVIELEERCCG